MGARGNLFEYVIRNEVNFHLVYGTPLSGMVFDNDKIMLCKILLPLGTGTDAEQWMSKAKCGRSNINCINSYCCLSVIKQSQTFDNHNCFDSCYHFPQKDLPH
jgi:hypothetical protein